LSIAAIRGARAQHHRSANLPLWWLLESAVRAGQRRSKTAVVHPLLSVTVLPTVLSEPDETSNVTGGLAAARKARRPNILFDNVLVSRKRFF